jgi:hypothetical protein
MLNRKLSPNMVVSRIALFTVIGAFLLAFTAAGTSAAGRSFIDSVNEFLGLSTNLASARPATPTVNTAVENISEYAPLSTYDIRWLGLKGDDNDPGKKAGESRSEAKPDYKQDDTGLKNQTPRITVGRSYHNDTSIPLREMRQLPIKPRPLEDEEREANPNPTNPKTHIDGEDTVVQSFLAPDVMPTPSHNFDGIGFPGVSCNCSPPDTNGEVGATQYVQMVNEGYQVFDKSTGTSVLGPASIVSLWSGFGGVCETAG